MASVNLDKAIEAVVKQFLCNVQIKDFVWHGIFDNLTYESQEILVNRTVNSSLVLNYQVEINYQKAFLKYIIGRLEKQCSEIHDELYSAYGRLVALPPRNQYFKHYVIESSGNIISIKENVHLISDGTTGLRTWQAALVLSEWSLSNAGMFKDKSVLELGSGVGLTGLTIATECSPSSIYLSDCHTSVLKTLCDNVRLNVDKSATSNGGYNTSGASDKLKLFQDRCAYHNNLGKSSVFVLNLPWEDVNKESCRKLGTINKVIAADVVYDSELFDPLIGALRCLASACSTDEFIFSCTERNRNTLENFIERVREASFTVEKLETPPQKLFIWPRDTPVRLFRFTTKL